LQEDITAILKEANLDVLTRKNVQQMLEAKYGVKKKDNNEM